MGKRFNKDDNNKQKNNLSRKKIRKLTRKELKIKKAVSYAMSKNTNKVCISSNDLNTLKVLKSKIYNDQEDKVNIISSLHKKILANDNNNSNNFNNKKRKKKKGKKKKGHVDKQQKENLDNEASFKLSSSTNSRLAKLQEYVNQEAKKITEQPKKKVNESNELRTDKLIKDVAKVKDLMQANANDEKKIKKMERKLELLSHQKKRIPSEFVDDFGDILEEIEEGMFDESKYNDITSFASDDKFKNDMLISVGKMKPHKISKSDCNTNDKSDDSENEFDESVDNFIEGQDESDKEAETDEENETTDNFLDDEAEESENEEENDEELEDKEDELLFESGSCIKNSNNSTMSARPSINTIFDLYAKNSEEEEEEEDSDLDGFIVDDNFVEYSEDEEPVNKMSKKKKSRIINRERLNSGDSDVIELDNACENENKNCKRRRIISESECEEVLDTESKEKCDSALNLTQVSCHANESDIQKSILKKTTDKKRKSRKKRRKCDDSSKPKKRVSFTLPEEETSNICIETKQEEYHEDIYGRVRDESGNIVTTESKQNEINGKYIPPAMRKLLALNNDAQKKEKLAQLQKKLKGQLNRLAESNMAGILSQIEMFYQSNSQNDMNDAMTKLLFEMLVTPVMTPEKLVQDHALLIASLSANVGNEVGAHILTEFVVKWVEDLENFKPTDIVDEVDSKELDNLLMFICQLYNFKVMESPLIYDILHKLLSRSLNPKEVDLILLILRSVGFTLRKDDPLALKTLITEINVKANESSSEQNGETYTRVKFMLEILTAIRNNNMNKVPNYDPTHSQHLKQLMKGFIKKGCRTSLLKVSLEDLLKSKVVGKWWIVGSAWSGGLIERNFQDGNVKKENLTFVSSNNEHKFSEKFQSKARSLKMTRPPKINILYAITEGATNGEEALLNLVELGLPKNQEPEIFNVLLFCCIRCKVYVPFYHDLALKLLEHKKDYERLLQFSIWDRFKDLDCMEPKYSANLAKFVADLIAENGLNLGILKKINFATASETTVSFLRQTLLGIFLHPIGTYAVSRAFEVICSNPKLTSLRQCLNMFIVVFIEPQLSEHSSTDRLLKSRVKIAVDKLSSVGGVKL